MIYDIEIVPTVPGLEPTKKVRITHDGDEFPMTKVFEVAGGPDNWERVIIIPRRDLADIGQA